MSETLFLLFLALVLDRLVGDPDALWRRLPHPVVLTYMQRKTADYDRWIGGMRRLRAKMFGG